MKFTSPVFSAVSGSIAGLTYSHNKGGMYTRARAVPTNPNTLRQQTVKTYLGSAVQAWNDTLTDVNRSTWNGYAAQVPMLDKLGQMQHRTGQQMWIRHYITAMMTGANLAPSFTGPPNLGEPILNVIGTITENEEFGVDASQAELNLTINWAEQTSAAGAIALYLGPPLNVGRNFYKGPYQLIARQTFVDATEDVQFQTTYTDLLNGNGALAVGQRRGVRVVVAYADGRVPQDWRAVLPVVDNVTP